MILACNSYFSKHPRGGFWIRSISPAAVSPTLLNRRFFNPLFYYLVCVASVFSGVASNPRNQVNIANGNLPIFSIIIGS